MTVLPFATQIKNRSATIKRDCALEVEVTLCVRGVIGPPCGVPSSTGRTRPSSITPALRQARMNLSTRLSDTRAATRAISLSWLTRSKNFQEWQNRLSVEAVRRSRARGLEMSRCWCRVKPADEQILVPLRSACPECGRAMRIRYSNRRAIVSLRGLVRLRLKIRRCEDRSCGRYHQAWRPEAEAALALPQHEFGLDVIALVGALRYREHRSVPEIHQELSRRGVAICERSVTNLLERYDELVAASAGAAAHRETLKRQGRAILAIDGL